MQNFNDIQFLFTQKAEIALQKLHERPIREEHLLSELERLRNQFEPEQASTILTLATLRQRASKHIPIASKLYFTREALEQATAWEIAQYRAQWIHRNAAPGQILDLGCGIGVDLLHLAKYRQVVGYELDPVRASFAQANAKAMEVDKHVEIRQLDWVSELRMGTLPNAAAAFIDPARRINGKRIYDVERMVPPLSTILQLQPKIPNLCVKLMPSIQDKDIPPKAQIKFISHQGICKESMLWLGNPCDSSALPSRSAAIHIDGDWREIDASQKSPPLGDLKDGYYLHEPEPAVIRSGAFWELCQEIDGWLFDPQIAYLVTCTEISHPLMQSFKILETHPFNLKKLNQRINVLKIGRVELKKRGMPFEPESMRKRLKLVKDGVPGVIIFTRRGQERLMFIAQRV